MWTLTQLLYHSVIDSHSTAKIDAFDDLIILTSNFIAGDLLIKHQIYFDKQPPETSIAMTIELVAIHSTKL